ncbi:MAG: glycerate kinase [Anaerolineales bacterium]|nr:MAG: glycerate kinase [Anaerolineales bacterium]
MNVNSFATHSLKDPRIRRILYAALEAVDPAEAVQMHLPKLEGNVHGLGIGKASIPMLTALAEAVPLSSGLAISKHASVHDPGLFPVIEGGHPVPDARSLEAGERALEFVSSLNADDTLVCLISGGGSALMTAPYAGISLEDMQLLTSLLLSCGARIDEINTLRRQLDRVKGGGLARATRAKVISLILSDVIGSPLEAIASGPTYPNPTTSEDALNVLEKYHIEKQVPGSIIKYLNKVALGEAKGLAGTAHESAKRHASTSDFVHRSARETNIIIGDNRLAAQAAFEQAEREGFQAEILTNELQGEAREVGKMLGIRLRDEISKRPHPFCLIAGGETTVTLRGNGRGGRNQELALAAVEELRDLEDVMLISLATDGEDGPTDAAGAVATGETAQRAEKLRVDAADHLSRNDAYAFFRALGDLIRTGPSGTNVNDLVFLVAL